MRNKPNTRRCYLCDETKPATTEHFPKDKNRYLGIGYQCRPCALRVRRERGDPRKGRWAYTMTAEQKDQKREWQKRYSKGKGRRHYRIGSYRYFDKQRGLAFDLDAAWFKQNIECMPCFYCGEVGFNGCDRIDNAIGHIKTNVVPCCSTCNTTRMDAYTHLEMIKIGDAIRQVKLERQTPYA